MSFLVAPPRTKFQRSGPQLPAAERRVVWARNGLLLTTMFVFIAFVIIHLHDWVDGESYMAFRAWDLNATGTTTRYDHMVQVSTTLYILLLSTLGSMFLSLAFSPLLDEYESRRADVRCCGCWPLYRVLHTGLRYVVYTAAEHMTSFFLPLVTLLKFQNQDGAYNYWQFSFLVVATLAFLVHVLSHPIGRSTAGAVVTRLLLLAQMVFGLLACGEAATAVLDTHDMCSAQRLLSAGTAPLSWTNVFITVATFTVAGNVLLHLLLDLRV